MNELREFKKALLENANLVLQLERAAASKTYSTISTLDQAKEYISKQDILLLYDNDVLIGKVSYKEEDKYVLIDGLIVLREFRGRGFGEFILKHILFLFPKSIFKLTVHPNNVPAVALYRKHGFKVVKEIPDYYGDGEPRVVMECSRNN